MKRVIQFTKLRFVMLVVSILLIGAGITGVIVRGGFNLGIDFEAGLDMRVQIAPEVFTITYNGTGSAEVNVNNRAVEVIIDEESRERNTYPFEVYRTVGLLSNGIDALENVSVSIPERVSPEMGTDGIIGFNHTVGLEDGGTVAVNTGVDSPDKMYASIGDVRDALMSLDIAQIQTVGEEYQQEFIIRIKDPGTDKDFVTNVTSRIEGLLGDEFGANQIIIKQSDYVGPRFSKNLGTQSIYLTILALALILIYVWIRFKLPYAVSAIVALTHDVLIMLGFIGTFQLEISTATMAAVLTIIGYSLNDTIVIFDRVRENSALLKENDFKVIVNTSITQSMSRTLITSLTTLLAVLSIYIFGTGSIKEFALNLIIGIVIGTYSSIFVASPILMGWMNGRARRKKRKDKQKYGAAPSEPKKGKEGTDVLPEDTGGAEKPKEDKDAPPVVPKQLERQQRGQKRKPSKKKKK